jgi:hypothetical protein
MGSVSLDKVVCSMEFLIAVEIMGITVHDVHSPAVGKIVMKGA